MNDLETAAKYREAAGRLRRFGWKQYAAFTWEGSFDPPTRSVILDAPTCAGGALAIVLGNGLSFVAEFDNPLERQVSARLEEPLSEWNDRSGRTKEEVIALFEGLAHDLELKHQIAAHPPEKVTA